MPRPKGSKNKKTPVIENLDERIAAAEAEISRLGGELKRRKTELRTLTKAKLSADRAAAARKAEEDRQAILAAAEASGKSVEELVAFLKGD